MKLFPQEKVVGIFIGFSEGGLEFHADIVLRYKNIFQSIPMHGQFLIVQLESENEAVLGRITAVAAQGKLAGSSGEDFGIRAVTEGRFVDENIREDYLKYRVDIRVLGVIRPSNGKVLFAPSHRRLPHVGSKVAFLSDDLLQEVAGHNLKDEHGNDASEFGYLAYGEFVYNGEDGTGKCKLEPWMLPKKPSVISRFRIDQLVSRRSFVFARAGYGKSNLVKLLFSSLYASDVTITKREGKKVPVGTLIFDPDGEYFWPDDSGRPGLCDVPHLEKRIAVFTNKKTSSEFYQSFVASGIKLDIRRLKPSDVVSLSLSPEKQNQQNVQKVKGLNPTNWAKLINLIYKMGNTTPLEDLREIILNERDNDRQDMEMIAIRSNMTNIVRLIHDPSSQMMDKLFDALRNGKICVVDISQMRGQNGLVLTGLVLQQIFEHNQTQFTEAEPDSIPTIAVLEEAQSVLGNNGGSDSPYIAWVKEGRKYGLGAVLITQQPGSISDEILSQGDNWFIFHLLSAGDLQAVRKANAHFSNDLLSSLLNEPIAGNGIFWSGTGGKPYPISVRVLSFENLYQVADKDYKKAAAKTFAIELREKFEKQLNEIRSEVGVTEEEQNESGHTEIIGASTEDFLEMAVVNAIAKIKLRSDIIEKIKAGNCHWMLLKSEIMQAFPMNFENKADQAQECVSRFMNEVFGNHKWNVVKKPGKSDPSKMVAYLQLKP